MQKYRWYWSVSRQQTPTGNIIKHSVVRSVPPPVSSWWSWPANSPLSPNIHIQLMPAPFFCQHFLISALPMRNQTYVGKRKSSQRCWSCQSCSFLQTTAAESSEISDHERSREQEAVVWRRWEAADKHQNVRSFSPSEEKHSSTLWSETSVSVGGFHLGFWSLSTRTGSTQRTVTFKWTGVKTLRGEAELTPWAKRQRRRAITSQRMQNWDNLRNITCLLKLITIIYILKQIDVFLKPSIFISRSMSLKIHVSLQINWLVVK